MKLSNRCPRCGVNNDEATTAVQIPTGQEVRPKDGDFTICFSCGFLSRFVMGKDKVSLRLISKAEADTVFSEKDSSEPLLLSFLISSAALVRVRVDQLCPSLKETKS